VLLGLACGHLIDTVLQMNLRPEIMAAPPRSHSVVSEPLQNTEAGLNLILQNNIFDANSRSATATMTLASKKDALAAAARADLKLIGTVVLAGRSQVLLEGNNELKFYHLGDTVPGDGTIEKILRNQVQIRNRDQSVITLKLQEKGPLSTPATHPKAEPGRAGGEVKNVGENRWLISRSMGEMVRDNFAAQMRLVQMQPRTQAGKIDGFVIQRIDSRSILGQLGLRIGDVVIDVNNTTLDSPEKGLQIVQQLREARQITIAVERNNQPMSFSYEIQ
jgi:general secretion pathway protein C